MSLVIIYILIMTLIIGNCLFSIETSAFYSAKSALNQALIMISMDTSNILDVQQFEIDPVAFMHFMQTQMQQNYIYLDLELGFYFYNQATLQECQSHQLKCDGVQVSITSRNSYFKHQTEIRFEVSVGG